MNKIKLVNKINIHEHFVLLKDSWGKCYTCSIKIILILAIGMFFSQLINTSSCYANNHVNYNLSNNYYFPIITQSKDREWQTSINVTRNVTSTENKDERKKINLCAKKYDKDGTFLGVIKNFTRLGAKKTKILDSRYFSSDTESLIIESDDILASYAIFKTKDGTKLEIIPAIEELHNQLCFPVLLNDNESNLYKTITLLNPHTEYTNVDIIAYDNEGHEIDSNSLLPLSPMESRTFAITDVFDSAIVKDFSTIMAISDKTIAGLQLINHPQKDLVGLSALTKENITWEFPVNNECNDFALWTTINIVNTGENTASLTIEAFDVNNDSLGIIGITDIFPNATYSISTMNITNGIIPQDTAYIKINSNFPVSCYMVVGVLNNVGLAAIHEIFEKDQDSMDYEINCSYEGDILCIYPILQRNNTSETSSTFIEQREHANNSNNISSKKKVYLVPSIEDERMSPSSDLEWKLVCDGEGKREGNYQKEIAKKISDLLSSLYDVEIFEGSNCRNGKNCQQSEIGKKAKDAGADVLVSFHTNATDIGGCKGTRKGTITFYECYDTDYTFAEEIHYAVIESLESFRKEEGINSYDKKLEHWWTSGERGTNSKAKCKERNKSRDCKEKATDDDCDYPDWYTTTAHACLIESLFHDNKEESAILRSDEGQNAIAEGIANGIKNYFKKYGDQDDNPPSVYISSPKDGDTISGKATVSADAKDDNGIAKIEFYLDDKRKSTDTSSPYTWSWDTTSSTNGTHILKVIAYDTTNQTAESQISVTVNNSTTSDNPPSVSITSPANGATVSGKVKVSANATDDKRIKKVKFYLDDKRKSTDTSSPYTWSWNTKRSTDGSHTLKVIAYDTAKQTAESQISVTVDNSTTKSPAISYFKINNDASSTTSRTVTLNNTATGNPTQYIPCSGKKLLKSNLANTYKH